MLTATHPAPRSLATDVLSLADLIPGASVDVNTENPDGSEATPDTYIFTWFVPEAAPLQTALTNLLPDVTLAFQPVDDTVDYVALTRANFPPLSIGPFFIARNDETPPAGAIGLNIMPNRAFGSGEHATTTGCLLMYLEWAKTGLKQGVMGLDYGAGSGILAIAAVQHAALSHIPFPFVCLDNDPPSVLINAQNGAENGVASLLTCGEAEVPPVGQTYSLVFANILMQPLLELADGLVACMAPTADAGLILSGFTVEQGPAIEAAYTARGLQKTAQHQQAGWLAQLWQRV